MYLKNPTTEKENQTFTKETSDVKEHTILSNNEHQNDSDRYLNEKQIVNETLTNEVKYSQPQNNLEKTNSFSYNLTSMSVAIEGSKVNYNKEIESDIISKENLVTISTIDECSSLNETISKSELKESNKLIKEIKLDLTNTYNNLLDEFESFRSTLFNLFTIEEGASIRKI